MQHRTMKVTLLVGALLLVLAPAATALAPKVQQHQMGGLGLSSRRSLRAFPTTDGEGSAADRSLLQAAPSGSNTFPVDDAAPAVEAAPVAAAAPVAVAAVPVAAAPVAVAAAAAEPQASLNQASPKLPIPERTH